jgi:hypothetical protein
VGLKLQWNRYNTYVNNIVVNGGVVDVHSIWSSTDHYVARNIFVGTAIYSLDNAEQPSSIRSKLKLIDSNLVFNSGNQPRIVQWLQRTTDFFTWAQWLAGGLDVHSVVADPMFMDTANGDYRVKAGSPALALGFKNFPMDSFGVMPIPCISSVAIHNPSMNSTTGSGNAGFNVHYSTGRLFVSHEGTYKVTILTTLGQTVRIYNGKGRSSFLLNTLIHGAGVYFAVIHANSGPETRRFVIN